MVDDYLYNTKPETLELTPFLVRLASSRKLDVGLIATETSEEVLHPKNMMKLLKTLFSAPLCSSS